MAIITPRWEWRTFGTEFGAGDQRFAALTPESSQESQETYLLSPVSDANVKIRDALMDLKILMEVSASGLEQWRPVMKATFPLDSDAVSAVWSALGIPEPALAGNAVTLERLTDALAPHGVRAVPVHKRRARYAVDGCMSEMTEVIADGKPVRSVAIESENAAHVVNAVQKMGLAEFSNTSYPRGLRTLLGIPDGRA